jgi:hypothetical protein
MPLFQECRKLEQETAVHSLAWSRRDGLLAAGLSNGLVRVVRASGAPAAELKGNEGVSRVQFSGDGQCLVKGLPAEAGRTFPG